MQIQPTAAETMNAANANFQVAISERPATAFCDCCDNEATGTKDELRRRGWGFSHGAEFCPGCNF